jgi:nucleoside-diphosphate-sugar epimerase
MLVGVTGATGFLGRALVKRLVASGHRVRAWYRLGSDRGGLPAQVQWLPGNLGDRDACDGLVRGVDAVVHAAFEWPESDTSLLQSLRTNFLGSLQLIESARESGVDRFVYISSGAVHERILDDRPLDETHPAWPTDHYGAIKSSVEAFVFSYGLGMRWPICALRPVRIYGVDRPPNQSVHWHLVAAVLRGQPLDVSGGGKMVHADDVARAVEVLLHAPSDRIAGQAFECCDGYIANETVARIVCELAGVNPPLNAQPSTPRHQIVTRKLLDLGMTFGGEALLRQTIAELIAAWRAEAGH